MKSHESSPHTQLGAKLSAPAITSSQIMRLGAAALIERAASVKLVLIHAPAGFGKTTVMLQHRARLTERGVATAWLTLDRGDNDLSRLLDGLDAAVGQLTQTGQVALAGSSDIDDANQGLANQGLANRGLAIRALDLVERLARHAEPYALFLDDFEQVQTPGASELMRQIIENLPRRSQLVIGSRSTPELELGRLRVHGQLLEVDVGSLRFSIEETAEFFTNRGLTGLVPDALSRLHEKTDGWVAALWLSSVALEQQSSRSEFIDRFSGSEGSLADYLAQDVLAHQSPGAQEFLLSTSILRHLSAPLCDALLPGFDSAAMLKQLESGHVFLTPIEGEMRTYRYHSLFAAFLRAELARRKPNEQQRLHRAASAWFEAQQRPVPAIDHAIAGGDFEHAIDLLCTHVTPLLSEGRLRLLTRWFAALPATMLDDKPMLQVASVWAVTGTQGPGKGMALLHSTGLDASQDSSVLPYVRVLRPFLLAAMDRYEEAGQAGRESLSHVPSSAPLADALLANKMAAVFSILGEVKDARHALESARRAQGEVPSALNLMYSETVAAINDLREGRLREATARFRAAAGAKGTSWSGVLYADSLYERDELRPAMQLLSVYVPLTLDMGAPDQMIVGQTLLSRIAFQRGDVDKAFDHLAELEYIGHQRQMPRVVASAKLERARLRLLQGYAQAAKEELDQSDDPTVWQRVARLRLPANDVEDLELGRLRWGALAGQPQDVLMPLEEALVAAEAASRRRRALKLRLLHGIALLRVGNVHAAVGTMEQVLDVACTEGFVRLILDEGLAAGRLLKRFDTAIRDGTAGRRNAGLAAYTQRLLQSFGPELGEDETQSQPGDGTQPSLQEPLTGKELRVLQLLTDGYSNSAMAEKLFVSVNTVRTHLRNINAKLNASRRTQAVAIARRLGLVR